MLHLQLLPLMPADAVYRRYRHVYRQTAEAGEHGHHADEPYIGRHPSAQIAESGVYPVRHVPDPFFQSVHFLSFFKLSFNGSQIPVLHDIELLHREAVRVIVRPDRVQQPATGYKAPFRDVARPDERLPCVSCHHIRVAVEIARHAVHPDALVDIGRDYTVVIPLFLPVLVVAERTLVAQEQRPADIRLDSRLVGRQGEKQLVETPDMFFRLHRPVLRKVLGKSKYQGLPIVQHIDFLPLPFGEPVGAPESIAGNQGTERNEHDPHRANLPEARFYIL